MFDRYSVIDMFGPFYGENWYPAEFSDGVAFRWTGPEPTSTIRAPTLGARDLRFRWVFSCQPQEHQTKKLDWRVNGKRVAPLWATIGSYATAWADVHLQTREPSAVVSIAVPPRLLPRSDGPIENRRLGLAVHKLEIFALDAEVLGVEAKRLQTELDARELEIQELMNSTSWKLTRPLRWLKETVTRPGPSAHLSHSQSGD
jgi:hypothetical protein